LRLAASIAVVVAFPLAAAERLVGRARAIDGDPG
jgi:hypothetical protein